VSEQYINCIQQLDLQCYT